MAFAVYVLSLFMLGLCINGLKMPLFSWDTVPVFIHMCNKTGPFNQTTAEYIARFPMVTIEKGQGINSTLYPYNTTYAENKIHQACSQIKSINSSVICIFYYNSVLDWEFYNLHQKMLVNPSYWLRDSSNVIVYLSGDHSFPQPPGGMDVFDFIQTTVQYFWINECLNLTQTFPGIIDGCFVDRATDNKFNGYNFTQQRLDAYIAGHNNVSFNLQRLLNNSNKSVSITNRFVIDGIVATQLENFTGTASEIEKMMKYAQSGVLVQAHAGYFAMGSDNYCSDVNNSLSAFLIAAEKYSYYGCSRGWYIEPDWINWHYQYDLPLGEPLGRAVFVNNGLNDTYTRQFAGGTVVTYNLTTEEGTIQWGSWDQLEKYKQRKNIITVEKTIDSMA